jgi:hypothetical protein
VFAISKPINVPRKKIKKQKRLKALWLAAFRFYRELKQPGYNTQNDTKE